MKIESISPTSVMLYRNCPYCYLLKSQKKPQQTTDAMRFGIKVHQAIQKYHTQQEYTEDEEVLPYIHLYEQFYDTTYQECEKRLSVPLFDTGVELSFQIDLIKDDWIIEHKTSSSDYSQAFVDEHLQATFYSYGFRTHYEFEETGIKFNVFNTRSKLFATYDTFRDKGDEDALKYIVDEVLTGITNEEFEPRQTRWHVYKECPLSKDYEDVAYR